MPNIQCAFKVAIIGAGSVGSTTAYALLLDGVATDIALIDVNKGKAQGVVLDMEHSLPFTDFAHVVGGSDYELCAGANLVVITAGLRQKEGETRLDLARANRAMFQEMIPKILKAAPDAVFLIVSNPVDVLTYETIKISGLPQGRVFGSGTILDTARFQFHISQRLNINPKSIDAYVFGEHGDTSFPVLSSGNIVGKKLTDFKEFTPEVAQQCYEETKNAAYRIIHDVGYTCYSIATAIREIARAIADDTHQVFMLSVLLNEYYGHSDVCLSIPCVLGRSGIIRTLDIPLNENERSRLAKSVETLKTML
jgi:L-lactate dehydrogenase